MFEKYISCKQVYSKSSPGAGQGWEAMLHLEETMERGSWSFSGVAGPGWNNVLLLSQKVALTLKVLVQKGLETLKYFYIA